MHTPYHCKQIVQKAMLLGKKDSCGNSQRKLGLVLFYPQRIPDVRTGPSRAFVHFQGVQASVVSVGSVRTSGLRFGQHPSQTGSYHRMAIGQGGLFLEPYPPGAAVALACVCDSAIDLSRRVRLFRSSGGTRRLQSLLFSAPPIRR